MYFFLTIIILILHHHYNYHHYTTTTTGDGNFHVFIMFDPHNNNEVKAAKKLSQLMAHRAIELGGEFILYTDSIHF